MTSSGKTRAAASEHDHQPRGCDYQQEVCPSSDSILSSALVNPRHGPALDPGTGGGISDRLLSLAQTIP